MPRAPHFAQRTRELTGSVFEALLPRLRARGDFVKLHIGDSHRPPFAPIAVERAHLEAFPHALQYPATQGVGRLRAALAEVHAREHALSTTAEQVLVSAGATQALSAIVLALVDPGEEVLVPTPSWPFFRGMVPLAGGTVRELPLYDRLDTLDVAAALEDAIGDRTVAIYLNSPNNPSGRVLDDAQRRAVLAVARRRGLWVVSDEAYDGLAFDGRATPPLAVESDGPDVLSVFTFSKLHLLAGLRLGWVRGDARAIETLNRVSVHQVYSASALAQTLVLDAVRTRAEWATGVRAWLESTRDDFVQALGAGIAPPQGTYFVFFDTTPYLRGRTPMQLVEACLDAGVAVTPGGDFGRDYASWMRLCFAAETRERALDGARRLRRQLEG